MVRCDVVAQYSTQQHSLVSYLFILVLVSVRILHVVFGDTSADD